MTQFLHHQDTAIVYMEAAYFDMSCAKGTSADKFKELNNEWDKKAAKDYKKACKLLQKAYYTVKPHLNVYSSEVAFGLYLDDNDEEKGFEFLRDDIDQQIIVDRMLRNNSHGGEFRNAVNLELLDIMGQIDAYDNARIGDFELTSAVVRLIANLALLAKPKVERSEIEETEDEEVGE